MPSEEYVVARRALLDALEALNEHLDSLVLVGAQAVYMHTGEADLAVAEHTTDADVAVDPRTLRPEPEIAAAMRAAGFVLARVEHGEAVGIWSSSHTVAGVHATVNVDLLTPDSLGGPGRRAARIRPHERGAVLKVHGIEAALVDNDARPIGALEESDTRAFNMRVAGPAALLVAKCIKLGERAHAADAGKGRADRVKQKDALDILRILRASDAASLARTLGMLRDDPLAGAVTVEALSHLAALFGSSTAPGSTLAAEAAFPEPSDVIAASAAALARELTDLIPLD